MMAIDYCCEDCGKFDESEIPANCRAGHGKVAFRHKACSDFELLIRPMVIDESEREEEKDEKT